MGFDLGSSSSRTRKASIDVSGQDYNAAVGSGRSQNVTGGVAASGRANVGGITLGKIGKGANLTFTTTNTDGGAWDKASALLSNLISNQQTTLDRSLADTSKLAETKATDGANLRNKTALIALGIIGAVVALVFYLRK